MGFPDLRHLARLPAGQAANTNLTQLPSSILEAFVPGYGLISRYLLETFAFDISLIVSVCVLFFALGTGMQYAGRYLSSMIFSVCSSSITIYNFDPIFDHILDWIAEQNSLRRVRNLKAETAGDGLDDGDLDDMKLAAPDLADDAIFNFNNWAALVPLRYQPHTGFHRFWHQGWPFWLSMDKDRVPGGFMGMMIQDQEGDCSRSRAPKEALKRATSLEAFRHEFLDGLHRQPTRFSHPPT